MVFQTLFMKCQNMAGAITDKYSYLKKKDVTGVKDIMEI